MAKLIIGIIIGVGAGILTGVLIGLECAPPPDKALQVTIEVQKAQMDSLRRRIVSLEQAGRETGAAFQKALDENVKQHADMARMERELKEAGKQIAGLRKSRDKSIAQLQKIIRRSSRPAPNVPRPPRKRKPLKAEKYLTKLRLARVKKSLNILRVGQQLSEAVIAELGLDEQTVARINALLKDESARAMQVLAQFLQENMPNPPGNLSELGMAQLLEKVIDELADELELMAQLPTEDKIKLARGSKDVLDYLGRDSRVVTLNHELYQVRQGTYQSLECELESGKLQVFKQKYLPPNDFLFDGGMDFAFGKIDWEKER